MQALPELWLRRMVLVMLAVTVAILIEQFFRQPEFWFLSHCEVITTVPKAAPERPFAVIARPAGGSVALAPFRFSHKHG